MNIIEAIHDPSAFRPLFKDLASWRAWMVYLRALYGLPIQDAADLKLFHDCTGLDEPPTQPAKESYVICGRRSGKSFTISTLAAHTAIFKDWRPYLAPGEKAWCFVIAVDKAQAAIIKGYISGIFGGNKIFKRLVSRETQELIELTNGVNITVKTSNFRTLRGYTLAFACLEELAWYRSEESANPDFEVAAAVKPALATLPGSLLTGISSPWGRSGLLFSQWKRFWGIPGGPLIWRASTETMNPTIEKGLIAAALAEDPSAARAEWLGEWREDIENFLSLETVMANVVPGRLTLPKAPNVRYFSHVDSSGGRQDSYVLCITSRINNKIVVDAVHEWRPPFSPEKVTEEVAVILKAYNLRRITSDNYAGEWLPASFKKHEITVEPSKLNASELYLNFLPLLMNKNVELPDNPRLINQLVGLERRVRAGGKDLITHAPGAHDDIANSVAGGCVLASQEGPAFAFCFSDKDFY